MFGAILFHIKGKQTLLKETSSQNYQKTQTQASDSSQKQEFSRRTIILSVPLFIKVICDMMDYSELINNDKSSGRIKDLEDALNGVEVTYSRWLLSRENIHTGEKPDRLGNYFRYFYDENGIQFYVKDGLPTDIKNACWSAFKGVFVNKK